MDCLSKPWDWRGYKVTTKLPHGSALSLGMLPNQAIYENCIQFVFCFQFGLKPICLHMSGSVNKCRDANRASVDGLTPPPHS